MNTAIIVEPRCHKALPFVLENFLENLSNDWNIIIFHGNLNLEYVLDIINTKLDKYKDRISLINLHVDNLTSKEYSELFIRKKEFYDHIPTETFLVFQTDTMIFKKNKELLNNFLHYDYVGAPWPWYPLENGHNVGNGGLSLRKKSKMLEVIEKETDLSYLENLFFNAPTNIPEDVFFSCTTKVELNKPSFEEAKLFSVEWVFSEISFGCHQPWIQGDTLKNLYPEIETLMLLNDR